MDADGPGIGWGIGAASLRHFDFLCIQGYSTRSMELLGGPLFAVAGAGESHGPAVTTIVFGCPPGLYVTAAEIQHYLDRRRPGSNKHGTPRREDDTVVLLSGLYQPDHDRLTAGPPIQHRRRRRCLGHDGVCRGLHHGRADCRHRALHGQTFERLPAVCGAGGRGAPGPHGPGQALQVTRVRRRARWRAIFSTARRFPTSSAARWPASFCARCLGRPSCRRSARSGL